MNIIAKHATIGGWSIAIDHTTEGYKFPVFVVNRVSPDGTMFNLGYHRLESEARKIANQFWTRDVKGDAMIGCGAPAI